MEEQLKLHPALELFLRVNNCYEEFISNATGQLGDDRTTNWSRDGIIEACKYFHPTIIDCFIWDNTPEGHTFWEERYRKCYSQREEFMTIVAIKYLKIL